MGAKSPGRLVEGNEIERIADTVTVVGAEAVSEQTRERLFVTIVNTSPELVVERSPYATFERIVMSIIIFTGSTIATRQYGFGQYRWRHDNGRRCLNIVTSSEVGVVFS